MTLAARANCQPGLDSLDSLAGHQLQALAVTGERRNYSAKALVTVQRATPFSKLGFLSPCLRWGAHVFSCGKLHPYIEASISLPYSFIRTPLGVYFFFFFCFFPRLLFSSPRIQQDPGSAHESEPVAKGRVCCFCSLMPKGVAAK